MNRREITQFLVDQAAGPGEFMAYKDYGESGTVAIAHNGMKFKYSNAQLETAAAEIRKPQVSPKASPEASKPAAKPTAEKTPARPGTTSRTSKPTTKRTTKRQTTTKRTARKKAS